ncbi:hypothetical protein BJY01DRAFT_246652 [Aspergillus pseudoustus]|uniref:C2H2-type domain-containing protein n=1 Tax=Aspergillus pseudoustus TaxID=1810923 RepID=A0ABR4K617_9EURO
MKLGADGFLLYNARYKVLICRDCQYGIQKNAIQSHLLRHKIYRDERRNLLSAIAELNILEPDDVPLPAVGSTPVDGLSIVHGYRCILPSCGHLCASSKRMKSHQSEVHRRGNLSDLASFSEEVKLQTFFRGNKVQYFQVTPADGRAPEAGDSHTAHIEDNHTADTDIAALHNDNEQTDEIDTHRVPFPDMETLRYFHHFTATTAPTLPATESFGDSGDYWQSHFAQLALQHQWLMSGLLAVSASHLATLAEESSTTRTHQQWAVQLSAQFLKYWDKNEDLPLPKDTVETGTNIARILSCFHWMRPELGIHTPAPETCGLEFFMNVIRQNTPSPITARTTTWNEPHTLRLSSSSRFEVSRPSIIVEEALSRLHDLPSRMTEALEKPENVQDVLVTLEAIAVLIKCCELAFSSRAPNAAWEGMTSWLAKVPPNFHELVLRHSLGAYIVVAHWAALLVQRVENCGYWFLGGATHKVLRLIKEELAQTPKGANVLPLIP